MARHHEHTQTHGESTGGFKPPESDDRDRATESERPPGGTVAGRPGPQDNDDCIYRYYEQRHSCYDEAVPSAGWRAVYARMGVAPR